MDNIEFNRRLNGLKDAYPNDIPLIETVQTLFNKKVVVITDAERRALYRFPMQFIQRIPIGDGEWTTRLHIWADMQLEDLLHIDPMMLTAKNSYGDSVLLSLIMAACGRFTQQVNYDLIQKILSANMSYVSLTVPGDKNSAEEGNAWDGTDFKGTTPMDYLIDMADSIPDGGRLKGLIDACKENVTNEDPVDNIDYSTMNAAEIHDNAVAEKEAAAASAKAAMADPSVGSVNEKRPTETPATLNSVMESLQILGRLGNSR